MNKKNTFSTLIFLFIFLISFKGFGAAHEEEKRPSTPVSGTPNSGIIFPRPSGPTHSNEEVRGIALALEEQIFTRDKLIEGLSSPENSHRPQPSAPPADSEDLPPAYVFDPSSKDRQPSLLIKLIEGESEANLTNLKEFLTGEGDCIQRIEEASRVLNDQIQELIPALSKEVKNNCIRLVGIHHDVVIGHQASFPTTKSWVETDKALVERDIEAGRTLKAKFAQATHGLDRLLQTEEQRPAEWIRELSRALTDFSLEPLLVQISSKFRGLAFCAEMTRRELTQVWKRPLLDAVRRELELLSEPTEREEERRDRFLNQLPSVVVKEWHEIDGFRRVRHQDWKDGDLYAIDKRTVLQFGEIIIPYSWIQTGTYEANVKVGEH